MQSHPKLLLATAALLCPLPLLAQEIEGPIAETLMSLDADVQVFNEHVVTLASPFMEGRVPGSNGMEVASQYMEYWLEQAGLVPAFDELVIAADGSEVLVPRSSWRQPFELGGSRDVTAQHLACGPRPFEAGDDFIAMAMGDSGEISGQVVFVGYGVDNAAKGHASYEGLEDLSGKIAVMLRFEPVDENGKSVWGRNGNWSSRGGYGRKLRAVKKFNPAAVLILNPPAADDPRIHEKLQDSRGSRSYIEVPVALVSLDAGERIAAEAFGLSLAELQRHADAGQAPLEGRAELSVACAIESVPLMAANVGGVLEGRGELADEWIVIGAHLDHLGMGSFGSRGSSSERGSVLHPGADDNASGSAGVLMLADKLADHYAAMGDDADARSILFVGFSAEESGLNGSFHYVQEPLAPLDQHALMINFDMIGRITNKRLSVSGAGTAEGMSEWLEPLFAASSLEIVQPEDSFGGSDHLPFLQKEVPALFGIIADFHDDYHTPRDVSSKINRVDAVETVKLFEEIALTAATWPEPFVWSGSSGRRQGGQISLRVERAEPEPVPETEPALAPDEPVQRAQLKVRFGIGPGSFESQTGGVLVGSVTEGSSAAEAGVQKDDVLVKWNGEEIADLRGWMDLMAGNEPGDRVKVTLLRGGSEMVLWATLQAREDG